MAPHTSQPSTGLQIGMAFDTFVSHPITPRQTALLSGNIAQFANPYSRHAMAMNHTGHQLPPLPSGPIEPPFANQLASLPFTWHMVWNQFFCLTSYRLPSSYLTSTSHSQPRTFLPSMPTNFKNTQPTSLPSMITSLPAVMPQPNNSRRSTQTLCVTTTLLQDPSSLSIIPASP